MTKDLRPSCVRPCRLRSCLPQLVAVAAFLLAFPSASLADEWTVARASGDVRIKGDGFEWVDLATRRVLPAGYSLSTGWNGRVLLRRGEERLLLSPRMSIVLPAGNGRGIPADPPPGREPVHAGSGEAPEGPANSEKREEPGGVAAATEINAYAALPETPENQDASVSPSVVSAEEGVATGENPAASATAPRPRPRVAAAMADDVHPLRRAMTTLRTVTTTLKDIPAERAGKHPNPGRGGGLSLIDRIRQGSN